MCELVYWVGGTVGGRVAVVKSCVGVWVTEKYSNIPAEMKWAVFSAVALLSCVEKPCSVLNMMAVERGWVSSKCRF